MKYAGLSINRIIMHEVSRGAGKDTHPQLSDVPTEISESDRVFIQERIRGALPKDARPIVEESGQWEAPTQIKTYLQSTSRDIVTVSQVLVKCLQESQSAVSPGGIFVFAEATLDNRAAVLIAKLEHQEGVQVTPTKLVTGETTFDVELLRNLLFTNASRVYKVALFVADEIDEDNLLHGVLVDRQMTGSSVAQFFMTTFLGSRLAERADLLTERFFNGAQSYINGIADPEKRARYEVALLSEMQAQGETLSVMDFAAHHLDVGDRDEFTHSLQGSGVPSRTFAKNNSLVKSKISMVKLNTEAGVKVFAPPETVENGVVSIRTSDDESAVITIKDRLAPFK